MYSQGSYYYDQQPRRYVSDEVNSSQHPPYAASDGGWYGSATRYPAADPYSADRRRGPLGDVYGVVDRPPRSLAGSDSGVISSSRQPSSSSVESRSAARQNVYDLEHLVTFNATGTAPGRLLTAPSGVSRVREMARAGSIWPLRVKLILNSREIILIDARSGDEMEHFPLSLVSDPTSAMATNRRTTSGSDPLDNIVLFTVLEDPVSKASPPEMHIFQCLNRSGQDFVDDVLAAKAGKLFSASDDTRGTVPQRAAAEPVAYDEMLSAERAALAASRYTGGPQAGNVFRESMKREGWEPGKNTGPEALNEQSQRGLTLLDRCFSDIEQFVFRIQQAASAFKELDNRKSVRVNKGARQAGDGLLGMRARPPPVKDFIDILQKFKLSFILLAKLKSHIRDPNAPELVHFLFTPLALVVDASSSDGGSPSDLASRVIAPLPTPESHELLDNCLTSKENELLRSLGPAWNTSIDKWKWDVPIYLPRFYDGWQPPAFWLEEIGVPAGASAAPRTQPVPYRRDIGSDINSGPARSDGSFASTMTDQEIRNLELKRRLALEYQRNRYNDPSTDMQKLDLYGRQIERSAVDQYGGRSPKWDRRTDAPVNMDVVRNQSWDQMSDSDRRYRQERESEPEYAAGRVRPDPVQFSRPQEQYNRSPNEYADRLGPTTASRSMEPSVKAAPANQIEKSSSSSGMAAKSQPVQLPSPTQAYVQQLRARGAKIFKVICDRESKNSKELTVKVGEIVEVLDDQKNWWKVSNSLGQKGFVPKTILIQYSPSN